MLLNTINVINLDNENAELKQLSGKRQEHEYRHLTKKGVCRYYSQLRRYKIKL